MGEHPKGLMVLFGTEMAERFSYYGMRAIFTLFLIKALMFDKAAASQIYGSYTGLVYLTPLIGGYVADNYWGNRKSIIIGGIMMAIGQFMMFMSGMMIGTSAALLFCFAGLALLIFGNGFFKPNISTMVGQLYQQGDTRVDAAFTIFYMGINIGAFFSPLVCGTLGDTGNPADFKWGFLAAGIGMLIGLAIFMMMKDQYLVTPEGAPIGDKPNTQRSGNTSNAETIGEEADVLDAHLSTKGAESTGFDSKQVGIWGGVFLVLGLLFLFVFKMDYIASFIFAAAVAAPGLILFDPSLNPQERDRILVVIIIAFFVIAFWGAFEQAGASLTFFADEQTDRNLFGMLVPASYFQSINPLAIVLFAPLFAGMWTALGKRGMEPASPVKQAIGMLLLCAGYVVIWYGVGTLAPGQKASIFLLFSMYMMHTFGELCLSPIGLSMVSKLSPARFASLMMGVWFLSTAAANKFAGTLSALYPAGEGEFKTAAENGISNLKEILSGSATATAEQIAKLKDLGIADHFPSIFGFTVTNLSDFFMIFIIMSGVCGAILLLISGWLLKKMHGIR
jgi:proton-dependent oligopeptide transporter, POT family